MQIILSQEEFEDLGKPSVLLQELHEAMMSELLQKITEFFAKTQMSPWANPEFTHFMSEFKDIVRKHQETIKACVSGQSPSGLKPGKN
jgi:hypothetical protein